MTGDKFAQMYGTYPRRTQLHGYMHVRRAHPSKVHGLQIARYDSNRTVLHVISGTTTRIRLAHSSASIAPTNQIVGVISVYIVIDLYLKSIIAVKLCIKKPVNS